MVWRYYLDISTLQVFINNLCTIHKGVPTNGIQGFVRHIFSAIHEIRPTCSCMLGYGAINF